MEKALKKYGPIFTLPIVAAFTIGFIVPFIQGLYLSFCKFTTIDNATWNGFNNYLYVFASKDATLDILNCTITVAQQGYFDELGEWVNEGVVNLANNKTLSIKAGVVYRVRIASINPLADLETLENSGYKSPLDSIRG